MLHALVEQIFLHEPDLATFSQELTEFKAVSAGKRIVSLPSFLANIAFLKTHISILDMCDPYLGSPSDFFSALPQLPSKVSVLKLKVCKYGFRIH